MGALDKKTPYELDDVLKTGQHKGLTLKDVILKDCGYITWMFLNVRNFSLSNEANKFFTSNFKKDDKPHYKEKLRIERLKR